MIPIVTPEHMATIDAAATEPVGVLIGRAGAAVARVARSMMGGTYGRTVNVIAGKGNNGADGRVAGDRLAEDGALVRMLGAADCPPVLPASDLVIDAAYGTGFRSGAGWRAPDVGGTPVLAVDIPSGVDGLTGVAAPGALRAQRTVTFAALKPGLLFGDGPRFAGPVTIADIGLDVSGANAHVVERCDVGHWWPPRPPGAHKWSRAVRVVAGSAGMSGAAALCSAAAMRAGAGIVWLSVPGGDQPGPVEVVGRPLPASGWAGELLVELDRFGALVVGPGLGRADRTPTDVISAVSESRLPVVVDGDGLFALTDSADGRSAVRGRTAATVLTPHDGEYRYLMGASPSADRVEAARQLAAEWSVVALLKGPATVVAEPTGRVRVVNEGDERLATAGTGDVLAGVIGALLASGIDAFDAAAGGAWVHGAAANTLASVGVIASDLLVALPRVLGSLE